MKIAWCLLALALLAAGPAWAQSQALTCNNGIVTIPLSLDAKAGTVTVEGAVLHVNPSGAKIAFSTSDPAGDKIDYVLDRAANLLTETDHDRMPDGSFKTIVLQFACSAE
jgi:hypothetical protein